jgi:hypothetical protein
MSVTTTAHDHLVDVIASAIGPNDSPTDAGQRATHRENQIHQERFMNIESKEVTQ